MVVADYSPIRGGRCPPSNDMEQVGGQRPPLNKLVRKALSPTGNVGDAVFRLLMLAVAALVLVIVVGMILALASHSTLSMRQFGLGFLTGRDWNPSAANIRRAAIHLWNAGVVADRARD